MAATKATFVILTGQMAQNGGLTQNLMDRPAIYEVRPRKDKRGVDLVTGVLPQVLAIAALLGLISPANGQRNSEDQAVRKVIADFIEAINRSDIKAFGALFTDDADFVVITGKYLKGQSEIVAYHAGLFASSFKGSHLDITSIDVRLLRPDAAVARVGTKRTENEGKEMRTSFPMFVLTKQAQKWLITAVQNTLTSGPPVPPVGAAK